MVVAQKCGQFDAQRRWRGRVEHRGSEPAAEFGLVAVGQVAVVLFDEGEDRTRSERCVLVGPGHQVGHRGRWNAPGGEQRTVGGQGGIGQRFADAIASEVPARVRVPEEPLRRRRRADFGSGVAEQPPRDRQ